jgi:hypothetical protein
MVIPQQAIAHIARSRGSPQVEYQLCLCPVKAISWEIVNAYFEWMGARFGYKKGGLGRPGQESMPAA